MHFNADTSHCGPCFPDVHRLSYFFLAKRIPVKETNTLKEVAREEVRQSKKSKEDTNLKTKV